MKIRELLLWAVLLLLGVFIWHVYTRQSGGEHDIRFEDFMARVDSGAVRSVVITGRRLSGVTKDNQTIETMAPTDGDAFVPRFLAHGLQIDVKPTYTSPYVSLLYLYTSAILPWFTLILVIVAFIRLRSLEKRLEGRGGGNGPPDEG